MIKKEAEFRSDLWKTLTSYRVKIVRSIIKNKLFTGRTKKEIQELFGKEDNHYDLDEWSYPVKKNFLGGETYLLLNFKGENVEGHRLYTIYQVGNENILSI